MIDASRAAVRAEGGWLGPNEHHRQHQVSQSLLRAGLVDRFQVAMFPVITGATGAERIYDGYPDVALDMILTSRRSL
jgi:hypothetical protein